VLKQFAITGEGWRHEIATEGNVKTVRTLGGSVWGGTARLVEEASIGVIDGADEYMLGQVVSICSHGDRIYVLDRQVPTLRVYDLQGVFIRNIGRKGGGPGEYDQPTSVRVNLVDGRIFVRDGNQGRLNVYTPDGEPLDTWPLRSGFMTSNQLVVTPEGEVMTYVWGRQDEDSGQFLSGMAALGPEGATGDTLFEPVFDFEEWTIEYRDENSWIMNRVPFAPTAVWTISPLRRVIGGVSTDYRLQIFHPDGAITVIEKEWERVEIAPAEKRWYRAEATANMRGMAPGWVWNGKPIPDYRPPFNDILTDADGRIWVRCAGAGIHIEDGVDDPKDRSDFYRRPAWKEFFTLEVFDLDGRFLGPVGIPEGLRTYPEPYIRGDMVLALVEGADGVPFVKRFRLVLPGEAD